MTQASELIRRVRLIKGTGAERLLTVAWGVTHWPYVHRSIVLSQRADRFDQSPENPRFRIIIAGESTAHGVGVEDPKKSVAGVMGEHFPDARILNVAEHGLRIEDLYYRLHSIPVGVYDVMIILIGSNDILTNTSPQDLRRNLQIALAFIKERELAKHVIIAQGGNIGKAPIFRSTRGWRRGVSRAFQFELSRRTRALNAVFRDVAKTGDARFVSFLPMTRSHTFDDRRNEFFADDGLHPNEVVYRWVAERLVEEVRELGY